MSGDRSRIGAAHAAPHDATARAAPQGGSANDGTAPGASAAVPPAFDAAGFDAAAFAEPAASAVGLTLVPAHMPGVVRFLAIAAEMAATVDAAPLDERALTPAPVFRLPGPYDNEPSR